jgi:hypothetical protein
MAPFTGSIYTDEFRLIVPLAGEPTDLWTLCMTPFRPFKASAWFWIAVTVFYMAWCLDVVEGPPVGERMPTGYYHFIGKILKDDDGNPESTENPSLLTKVLDCTIGRTVFALYNGAIAFTGGGSHLDGEDGGQTAPGKLIKVGFNIFGLIVLTAYTASSAAGLVVAGQRGTIESIDGIVKIPSAKLCVRTAIIESFELRYPSMKGKTLTSDTAAEMLQNVDDGKCVGAMIMADAWDSARAQNPDAHCNKIAVGETLMIVGNGMPIRPEWHMPISFMVAQMVSSGRYAEVRADYKSELVGEPACAGSDGDDGEERRRLLSAQGEAPLRLLNHAPRGGGVPRNHRRLAAARGPAQAAQESNDEEENLDGQPVLDEMDLFAALITTFIGSTAGLLLYCCCGYSESCPVGTCQADHNDQEQERDDPETMPDEDLLRYIARKLQKMDNEMHGRHTIAPPKEERRQYPDTQEPILPDAGATMSDRSVGPTATAAAATPYTSVVSHHGVQPGDYFEQAMLLQQRMQEYAVRGRVIIPGSMFSRSPLVLLTWAVFLHPTDFWVPLASTRRPPCRRTRFPIRNGGSFCTSNHDDGYECRWQC